jgi:hypothetical protein
VALLSNPDSTNAGLVEIPADAFAACWWDSQRAELPVSNPTSRPCSVRHGC